MALPGSYNTCPKLSDTSSSRRLRRWKSLSGMLANILLERAERWSIAGALRGARALEWRGAPIHSPAPIVRVCRGAVCAPSHLWRTRPRQSLLQLVGQQAIELVLDHLVAFARP